MQTFETEKIDEALEQGLSLRGFRSGGGLRVVRLEEHNSLKGYGEHPNLEEALRHLNEDYAAGGREYSDVYGPIHPHYLTGSSTPTSELDAHILGGNKFKAFKDEAGVHIQITDCDYKPEDEIVAGTFGDALREVEKRLGARQQ
jgi:hypothetical protein